MFRKPSLSLIVLFLPLLALAQPTQPFLGMNYQAVVRDANGEPLLNQAIGVEFSVMYGLATAYKETQALTTDANGILTTVIGQGTPTGGAFPTFSAIEWHSATLYGLVVLMDLTGGTNYNFGGGEQLRCVPFAALSRQAVMLSDSAWVSEPAGDRVWSDSNYDVGIGTQTPQAKLHVAGNVRIADGTQAAGRVLTSDADGDAVWSTKVLTGSYTPTWTNGPGFTTIPATRNCEWSRVGQVVNVVCEFTTPNYSGGPNYAVISLPPGLPLSGNMVAGVFNSQQYSGTGKTGMVSPASATAVYVMIGEHPTAGASPSWCTFTYRTSAP